VVRPRNLDWRPFSFFKLEQLIGAHKRVTGPEGLSLVLRGVRQIIHALLGVALLSGLGIRFEPSLLRFCIAAKVCYAYLLQ